MQNSLTRLIVLVLLANACGGCHIARRGEPLTASSAITVREVHDSSPNASVTVRVEGDVLTVDALSPKGIGGTRLVLNSGRWPARVKVRLRYSETRPFNTLEGPGAQLEPIHFDASTKKTYTYINSITRIAGGYEFEMPDTSLPVLYIDWVDAYR